MPACLLSDQTDMSIVKFLYSDRCSGLIHYDEDIVPDKSGYQVNVFLISPWKHMLWALIRRMSLRR